MLKYFFLPLILITFSVQAQNSNTYYYYKGKRIDLEIDKTKFHICTDQNFITSSINLIGHIPFQLNEDSFMTDSIVKWGTIELIATPSESAYIQKYNGLKNTPGMLVVTPYIIAPNGESAGLSNYFYIRLKASSEIDLLQLEAQQIGVKIVSQNTYDSTWVRLCVNSTSLFGSLESCNRLYETGLFADSDPNFLVNNFFTVSDEGCILGESEGIAQWGLNNPDWSGYDVEACDAWTIATGNGIDIAVIDQGISDNIYPIHTDLAPNMSPFEFDCVSGSPSSKVYGIIGHGLLVGGVIGAELGNGLWISGMAPDSKIMDVSHPISTSNPQEVLTFYEQLSDGINWAWQNGAEIINCSWGGRPNYIQSTMLESAIENALTQGRNGLGTIVVFASGNKNPSLYPGIQYPAYTHKDILVVGNMQINGTRYSTSDVGATLDVAAPGTNIRTLRHGDNTTDVSGTSFSAPLVSGIAALILEVNPCLSVQEVNRIIESTCLKAGPYAYSNDPNHPNGTWTGNLGHGLVNSYESVLEAQNMYSATLDLYMRDRGDDMGYNQGYIFNWNIDESPDIWVRNQNDGVINQDHQNPVFDYNPNYVYVRVSNKSCVPSGGEGVMSLYWTQASSNSSWPNNWNGTSPLTGSQIGSQQIPNIEPGESTIMVFPWSVLNPSSYGNWNSCLLARIEGAVNDTITVYPNDLAQDIYMNNNISARNTEVITMTIDEPPVVEGELYPHGGIIHVGNVSNENEQHDIIFFVPNNELDNPLTDEAEVTLTFDSEGWNLFSPHFKNREDIRIISGKRIQLLNPHVKFSGVEFEANQRIEVYIGFSFLTKEITAKNEFRYHVVQKKSIQHPVLGDHWTGGVHFTVSKKERVVFQADAGNDRTIVKGEIITVNAVEIPESAIYQWFNKEGVLIQTGKKLLISPLTTQKYKLEVVSTIDGFKDFDEINIEVDQYYIKSISPNPVSNNVTIDFEISDANSAYIMIIGSVQSTITNNYILSPGQLSHTIDVTLLPSGAYSVVLVCDGVYEDVQSLQIL